ncbi:MAG: pyridoxamine 5'-phosphate oxidase family protein [Methanobacterium sp.]|uniref:pyridoxamine 5'-phosphate oxidase family protein n=1 Tax=Methanobacterium sp. TaxID=2164 RepID=UPI003D658F40|nr:pyridoxamine 5'-phosphate oxidase family protein [Methanobacterium sp.]
MNIFKIPQMNKKEYDKLINENYISRIAFNGDSFPYIAPFMYIFDKNEEFLYFLSTNYGIKIDLIKKNPKVAVEIEKYSNDMSNYQFITLQGRIIEVNDDSKGEIKEKFIKMINDRKLSNKSLSALGYSPDESPNALLNEERILIWKLVDVDKIVALKNP